MISPILEAAVRFRFPAVIFVGSVADSFTFFWIWDFYRHHPPLDIGEYYEAAITSLTFLVVAVAVWWLVNDARIKGARLARNLQELERTREKLLQEEKLAAVGRFSSAIAHELRNPVAMIASSIATAKQLEGKEYQSTDENPPGNSPLGYNLFTNLLQPRDKSLLVVIKTSIALILGPPVYAVPH